MKWCNTIIVVCFLIAVAAVLTIHGKHMFSSRYAWILQRDAKTAHVYWGTVKDGKFTEGRFDEKLLCNRDIDLSVNYVYEIWISGDEIVKAVRTNIPPPTMGPSEPPGGWPDRGSIPPGTRIGPPPPNGPPVAPKRRVRPR